MSEPARAAASGAESAGAGGSRPAPESRDEDRSFFQRIALFFRQVVAELRKVVWIGRADLLRYTSVVLVFVAVVMAFVTLIDLGVGTLVGWVFGG